MCKSVSAYYVVHSILSRLEQGEDDEKSSRKAAATAIMRRLDNNQDAKGSSGSSRRFRKEDLTLNQYEQRIALDVVAPEDIPVKFDGKLLSEDMGIRAKDWEQTLEA